MPILNGFKTWDRRISGRREIPPEPTAHPPKPAVEILARSTQTASEMCAMLTDDLVTHYRLIQSHNETSIF